MIKKILISIKNNYRYDYLIFFILGLISLTWFKGDYFISGGCFTWHPDFREYLTTTAFVWEKSVSTGYSLTRIPPLFFPYALYGRIFQFIFRDSLIYEKALFYICFSVSGASFYFLLKTLGLKRIPRLIGALFYMLNPFASVVVWYLSIGLYFPFYSFLPLAVALFIRAMEGRVSFVLANILIFLSPLGISYASPVMFSIFYFILFSYFLFRFLGFLFAGNFPGLKKLSLLFFGFNLLLFLLNAFWMIPFAADFQHQYEVASNVSIGLAEDLPTLRLNSLNFWGVFRLLGLWSFDKQQQGDWYYPWHKPFFSPIFILFSFVLGLLVLFGVLNLTGKKDKDKFVWFFLLLCGIVSISGLYFPVFSFLNYLYQKIPYVLRAFRGGFTKFGFIYVLPYTVLFSFGVEFLYQKFGKWVVLVLVPVVFIGFPLFTGSVIHKGGDNLRSYLVKIPESYQEFQDWDEADKTLARYLVLPISKADTFSFRWENGYQGADYLRQFSSKAILNTNFPDLIPLLAKKINSNSVTEVNNLLALLNVKKILLRKDYNWLESFNLLTDDQEKINAFLSNYEMEKETDTFKIYRLDSSFFLPRFYIPQRFFYLKGDSKDIFEALGFDNSQIRSGYYLGGVDNSGKESKLRENGEDLEARIVIFGKLKDEISETEIENIYDPKQYSFKKEDFRSAPGSRFHFLSLREEREDKQLSKNRPEELLEKYLYYASKRLTEIENFNLKEKKVLNEVVENYQKEIRDIIMFLKQSKLKGSREFPLYWSRTKGLFGLQRDKLNFLDLDSETRLKLERIFVEFDQELKDLEIKRDFSKLIYQLEIPRSGSYEIFVKPNGMSYRVLGFEAEQRIGTNSGRLISADKWSLVGKKYFDKGSQEIVLMPEKPSPNLLANNLKIKEYLPNSFYRISFSYRSENQGSFAINEGKADDLVRRTLFPTGSVFKKIEFYFKSSPEATKATFFLSANNYTDLRVERISQPEIIVQLKELLPSANLVIPRISFVRINPTKYKVKVEGATEPYTLVFSESFHQGWKAYINELTDSKINELKNYGEIVASYFDGEIKERTHKNIFLDRGTFETLGEKPIAEERHFVINSYANAWSILPSDTENLENYELVVEFCYQKIFYLSLMLSSLTFIGSILFLFLAKRR